MKAYSVSEVDIQQVLASWQKLIRLELSMRELERDYRRSLAELERVVGVELSTFEDCEITRLPSINQNMPAKPPADDAGIQGVFQSIPLVERQSPHRQSTNMSSVVR